MNIIQIKNYSKIYKKNVVAVEDLNLNVMKGSFFGFIGPNGAGKTTTINFIAGLLKATKGELYLFDDWINNNSYKYKKKIGFVLEKPLFFEKLTANEYLTFVGQMYEMEIEVIKSRIKELFNFFELTEKKDKLIETYSAGMKKKVSLAAALIHDPELLILDEPFEGIDPVSSRLIKDNLKAMVKKGKTVFMTSHILDIVEKLCDNIAIINKGKLIFQGATDSIKEKYKDEKNKETFTDLEDYFNHLVGSERKTDKLSWLE